jgi:hypothetical protein
MKMHFPSPLFVSFFIKQTLSLKNIAKKVKKLFSWKSRELLKYLILLKDQLAFTKQHIAGYR